MNGSDLHFLIVESEPAAARAERRESAGRSAGETYADRLGQLDPGCACDELDGTQGLDGLGRPLDSYDAVFFTGSPLHLYQETPAARRQIELMRAVFASGTPSFGSCAGLQVATVAAGGAVRPGARGREVAFARDIRRTEAGRGHPLLGDRPDVYDALTVHSDEVALLPPDATLLAANRVSEVQAAEIRHEGGVFWGVQYHPELSLADIAAALRRESDDLVAEGLLPGPGEVEDYARRIEALGAEPDRADLASGLGLDAEVTDPGRRASELRSFVDRLVKPHRSKRGRA